MSVGPGRQQCVLEGFCKGWQRHWGWVSESSLSGEDGGESSAPGLGDAAPTLEHSFPSCVWPTPPGLSSRKAPLGTPVPSLGLPLPFPARVPVPTHGNSPPLPTRPALAPHVHAFSSSHPGEHASRRHGLNLPRPAPGSGPSWTMAQTPGKPQVMLLAPRPSCSATEMVLAGPCLEQRMYDGKEYHIKDELNLSTRA